ncbi:MAG TPA: DUF2889 domain-containing protein [Methylomirabilota bacterium]|nr:DUF2889 domain-containing protein [Methylomirabilota bacterium]
MLAPAVLAGRDRYERVMVGRIDSTHDDAFTHTVRLSDDDRALEVEVVALPSPTYAIREARLLPLSGPIDGALRPAYAKLAGTEMVGGLTRRVVELVGGGDGAALAVDATIEVGRLARQVARLPRAVAERALSGDALACWTLDTTGWADLPDSCFTYSPAGRALFGTRTIATPMVPDLYSPRPGQRGVFERRKVARLIRRDGRLQLFQSMHDNVHGFEITYEIDLATETIVRAEHVTPRLPYMGVCSEPQRRLADLLGERADAGLRKRIQSTIGGVTGCAQLYDLTSDVLKLLAP